MTDTNNNTIVPKSTASRSRGYFNQTQIADLELADPVLVSS